MYTHRNEVEPSSTSNSSKLNNKNARTASWSALPLYRYYHAKTGDHFYTRDQGGTYRDYVYEQIGFYAYPVNF